WDFWIQGRRIGTHMVHNWPGDALKVISKKQIKGNEWTHVALTYDGSSQGSGVKIYFNGAQQQTNIEANQLRNSLKTDVPFRVWQRSEGDSVSGAGIQDLRIYRRELTPGEIESMAKATRFVGILTKSPADRSDDEKKELYPWWLANNDTEFQTRTAKLNSLD